MSEQEPRPERPAADSSVPSAEGEANPPAAPQEKPAPSISAAAKQELQMLAVLDPTDVSELPRFLHENGWKVSRFGEWNGMKMLKCERDGLAVLLGVMQPEAWTKLADARRDYRVATAMPVSFWRFWRRPAEARLAQEVIREIREWTADEAE